MSKDLSHIHTLQNNDKWMISQLQATADPNKQYLAWGKSNETPGVKQSWLSILKNMSYLLYFVHRLLSRLWARCNKVISPQIVHFV